MDTDVAPTRKVILEITSPASTGTGITVMTPVEPPPAPDPGEDQTLALGLQRAQEFRDVAVAQLAAYPHVETRATAVTAITGARGAFAVELATGYVTDELPVRK